MFGGQKKLVSIVLMSFIGQVIIRHPPISIWRGWLHFGFFPFGTALFQIPYHFMKVILPKHYVIFR